MSMTRCNTCCMVSTRPDHVFVDGTCPACLSNTEPETLGTDELCKVLDRHHGEVIVPSSGGKDSTYQVLRLQGLGAHVTIVTATTCHLTPVGRLNIDNLKRFAKTIEVSQNQTIRRKLNRYGLEWVGDISWPEHSAIFSTPFQVAADTGIKLIIYGENPQRHYGGPDGTADAVMMTERWVSEFGGFLGMRPSDMIGVEGITKRDMQEYEAVWTPGVEAHFLGQYEPWDSRRNAKWAKDAGMIQGGEQPYPSPANWWRAENWDNAQTGIHDHFMYRKYGYGRGATQIAIDVRNGALTRAEALRWIHKYDGLFPHHYADVPCATALDDIGMKWERFLELMKSYTNWDLFDGEDGLKPILKC